MTTTQYISVRETAQLLGVSETKIMDLIEEKKLYTYRIADKFLRLKRSEVLALRKSDHVAQKEQPVVYTLDEKIKDFFYFNDFYILSLFIILGILYTIFYT